VDSEPKQLHVAAHANARKINAPFLIIVALKHE
jgi:hypothetical protein